MIKNVISNSLLVCIVVLNMSCKKESSADNPYDSWKVNDRGAVMQDLKIDPNTIEGLHKNIFKPTCANSGCHDGNFEPDFRTIESSYNSLLNRNVTNLDPGATQIVKRVVPGDAANSMLVHRITTFIPGSQGKMPFYTDPGSDWPVKMNQYLQNITNWINAGAKDQFGKSALSNDFPPQLGGLIVFADGSVTPLPHNGKNPVDIPAGTNTIKIMVAYSDDKTAVNLFGATTLNYSLNPNSYTNPEKSMITGSSAFNTKGILGTNIDYWHSITLAVNTLGALPKDVVWIRTSTSDNVNPPLFIPAATASFNSKTYFALRIN